MNKIYLVVALVSTIFVSTRAHAGAACDGQAMIEDAKAAAGRLSAEIESLKENGMHLDDTGRQTMLSDLEALGRIKAAAERVAQSPAKGDAERAAQELAKFAADMYGMVDSMARAAIQLADHGNADELIQAAGAAAQRAQADAEALKKEKPEVLGAASPIFDAKIAAEYCRK